MATAIVNIAGAVMGLDSGAMSVLPGAITTTDAQYEAKSVALTATTNNSITLPNSGNCTAAIIVPPVNNTVTLLLKGASGDTGLYIHKTMPTVIALDGSQYATQTDIVIYPSAGVTVQVVFL